jgi:hypothetical protein
MPADAAGVFVVMRDRDVADFGTPYERAAQPPSPAGLDARRRARRT